MVNCASGQNPIKRNGTINRNCFQLYWTFIAGISAPQVEHFIDTSLVQPVVRGNHSSPNCGQALLTKGKQVDTHSPTGCATVQLLIKKTFLMLATFVIFVFDLSLKVSRAGTYNPPALFMSTICLRESCSVTIVQYLSDKYIVQYFLVLRNMGQFYLQSVFASSRHKNHGWVRHLSKGY